MLIPRGHCISHGLTGASLREPSRRIVVMVRSTIAVRCTDSREYVVYVVPMACVFDAGRGELQPAPARLPLGEVSRVLALASRACRLYISTVAVRTYRSS